MAIIPQKQLFGWEEIEELGDLDRLRLVLEYLPDEPLMALLESQRGHGRDDYPIRAVWNSILAGVVFEHKGIESLRRESKRNAQLRLLCGFDLTKGEAAVPPSYVYTRFLGQLLKNYELVEQIFDDLVESLRKVLPDFGCILAMDGKAIETYAKPKRSDPAIEPDGRRDLDADFGKKVYKGKREDGTLWQKVKSWFGYKLHLIVDVKYELPVAFEITPASSSEIPEGIKLIKKLDDRHSELIDNCGVLTGDKGLDDTKLIQSLWDDYDIKPVIDIRNMWKGNEKTKLINSQENIVYDYQGNVYCRCPQTDQLRVMAFGGFEKDRESLKYRCPALHYGFQCQGCQACQVSGAVRIKLSEDRRVFTPIARSSHRWKEIYKMRTSVERVNSRLDVSFGFEHHFIRGQKKMKLRMGLALIVMLAMALGRIKEKLPEKMRSLVA